MTQQPSAPKRDLRLPPPSTWEKIKGKVYALILIALLLGVGALSAAMYNKAFDGSIPVTLKAGRAGLQMQAGNRVKVNGVDLGRVGSVKLNDAQDGVDIVLKLKPEVAKQVPTNATVSLEQLTAFGNKAVQVRLPAKPSGQFLAAGSVIDADHVSVEVNGVFDQLMTLLNEIQPSKLFAVTGSLANTFRDNGDTLGLDISELNSYLKRLNPDLAPLKRDFRSAGGFAEVYAGAANSIADTLRNAGTISQTLADKRGALENTLGDLSGIGDEIKDFFGENADPLVKTLKELRPTTSLLKEYAPMLTCFLDGSAVTYDNLDKKLFNESGAIFELNFVQPGGTEMYKYPRDLPEIGPGKEKGPNCRGLPVVNNNEDSLADYTTDPPSLNQRNTDNSPRLATAPDQQYPGFPGPPVPAAGLSSAAAASPLVRFFGPSALVPTKAPLKKAGK